MYKINDDLSVYVTRGDIVLMSVSAEDNGEPYTFQPGDLVRIKVYKKKKATDVVLEKDFPITDHTQKVQIYLSEEDTKIGEVISKPVDYWYEVELNPLSEPQTIIGYDEDGAKVFKLFPEGADKEVEEYEPGEEELLARFMDEELDLTSKHPVENQVIARAIARMEGLCADIHNAIDDRYVTPEMYGAVGDGEADDTKAIQKALDAGGRVVLHARYKVTSLTMSGAILEGYGATLIGDAAGTALTLESDSVIHGLTITGAHIGVLVKGDGCKVQDCTFANIYNRSIVVYGASECRINNCCFKNTGGIMMQGESGGTVKNNIVDGCVLDGITSDKAIYLNSTLDTLQITGCVINNCYVDRYSAVGIFVGGEFNTVSNCKIGKLKEDSTSTETPRPLWVHDGKGNVVEGCHFVESPRGLYIINARDTIISNCVFDNIAHYNINAIYNDSDTAVYTGVDGNSGVTIRGCVFMRGSSTYSAILIDSYKNVVVSDCVLRDGIMERLLRTIRSKYTEIASSVIVTNCFCNCAFAHPFFMYQSEELIYYAGVIDKNGSLYALT